LIPHTEAADRIHAAVAGELGPAVQGDEVAHKRSTLIEGSAVE
jgi:hypothetical protein